MHVFSKWAWLLVLTGRNNGTLWISSDTQTSYYTDACPLLNDYYHSIIPQNWYTLLLGTCSSPLYASVWAECSHERDNKFPGRPPEGTKWSWFSQICQLWKIRAILAACPAHQALYDSKGERHNDHGLLGNKWSQWSCKMKKLLFFFSFCFFLSRPPLSFVTHVFQIECHLLWNFWQRYTSNYNISMSGLLYIGD